MRWNTWDTSKTRQMRDSPTPQAALTISKQRGCFANQQQETNMMGCSKCNKDLNECICPDIDERMRALTGKGGALVAKWCMNGA